MQMISSALALSLLALVSAAPEARADRPSSCRSSDRSSSGELLELRNDWRRDVRFTISRVDRSDPYEFRLRNADRAREGRSRLSVGPVAPGRRVSVVVSTDGRVSRRDLRGRVQVTVRADDRRGRVLDTYLLPVDLRRRADRDDSYDHDDRYDRYDRDHRDHRGHRGHRDHRLSAWEREHRGHGHARGEVCKVGDRRLYRRPIQVRDLLRYVIASRHRD